MPVKKDPSGSRSVEAEVEVPGTPEEVWEAIATGPGMSAWFVPSTSDEEVGGKATNDFGPGMESVATITEWSPPEKFVAETEEEPGRVASEWHVEARSGGTCVVRVVHRWFADSDEWDHQFEGHTYGWQSFFRILRLYLEHFRGEPSAAFALSPIRPTTPTAVWKAVTGSLGVTADGESVETPSGPAVVERFADGRHSELLLRLGAPTPGVAHLFPMGMGDQTLLSVRAYLYGGGATDSVGAAEEEWSRWVEETLAVEPSAPSQD